jgi:hypothetical protein
MNRLAVAFIACVAVSTGHAQGTPPKLSPVLRTPVGLVSRDREARASDSVPRSIAEAEARGRQHPRLSTRPWYPKSLDSIGYVGTSERRCVDVGKANLARSGDFFAGPFALYQRDWPINRVHGGGKMFWQPVVGARPDAPTNLVVRVYQLDGGHYSRVWEGQPITTLAPVSDMLLHSNIVLPVRGRWLFMATAAENWGCFVYTLK